MGKPKPSGPNRSGSGSVELHPQPPSDRFVDDDAPELQVDDLPPLYDDVAGHLDDEERVPLVLNPPPFPGMIPFHIKDSNTGAEGYINSLLDNEPKILEQHVRHWAKIPPRPFIRLHGTHRQQVDENGKKESRTITDFDIQVELTPYLFSDTTNGTSFLELRTVENGDKARRGTVWPTRAPGSTQSLEVGLPAKPTLEEWCHRYQASHAGLKCFSLQRRMTGFDYEKVKQKLESLVRDTNYRGHLTITFPVKDEYVKVFNDCKTNRWRMTKWIMWLCVLTLMFIFTWPYLYFRTKYFEVMTADWAYSVSDDNGRKKFVSISEDQLYNLWGRAIYRAVLEKRQCTLDQQDLIAAEGAPPVFCDTGVVGGSLLRAGLAAMNEVNRQLGWGGDC